MGLTSILRGFGAMLTALGLAMIAPLLLAWAGGEQTAGAYAFGAAVSLIAGIGALAASAGRRPVTDFRGALMMILLWWIVVPVFAAIPFAIGPLDFGDAYFEAVSAMTTTGAWLSHDGAIASPAGMLWRAELQWLGGLASLAIAAAIFIRPAFIGIDTLLPPFSRGDEGSYARPLRNAVTAFLPVYVFLTLIAFCAIALAGAPFLDAVVIALSVISSGGFIPHTDGLSGYAPSISAALFPFILLGGANFVLIARLLRGSASRVRDIETGAYLLIVIWAGVLFWVSAGAGDVLLLAPQIFNAASFVTTNGYTIGEAPALTAAMVTAIIGGAAVSTAGGFKVLRWLVITARAREEVRRLILPNAVFGQRRVANELGVWMHFLVFTLILALLLLSFTIGGHGFETATAAAAAALSNTGPMLALAGGASGDYAMFDAPLKAVLIAGMILGRLEAAVALALINRAFWRA